MKRNSAESAATTERDWGEPVYTRLAAAARAVPLKSDKLQAVAVRDFLSSAQCEMLIELIDRDCYPSQLATIGADPGTRTSDTCELKGSPEHTGPIDMLICTALGIPSAHAERMQGQRYAPGQFFKPHSDYFDPDSDYWRGVTAHGGQRTWTAMVYLNDVATGGGTRFTAAGIKVLPKRGLLLAWNNLRANGAPNPHTFHEGQPVEDGVKYIVTKWFRERPLTA